MPVDFIEKGRELIASTTMDRSIVVDVMLDRYLSGEVDYSVHPDQWVRDLQPIDLSDVSTTNISTVEYFGDYDTFDLEVDHPDHQFYLDNGILTSNSHAVAYAIDSYMCAWLLAKHEEEWLCAYLESMSANPDDKAKAFAEIKSMGYKFVPIDINHASNTWTILPGKQFMPSFLSCKGVGESAVEEIVANRPYQGIDDFLWKDDGTWKHSKFNKKALDALIKVGAFESLNIVGPGKLFTSYRQMHYVLVENMDLVKKTSKKDPNVGRNNFYRLIEESKGLPDWTYGEKAANQVECFGSIDVGSLMDPVIADKLQEKGVKSIDQIESEKDIFWFVVESTTLKKTKNGKTYLAIEAKGTSGATFRIFCWGWPADKILKQFTVCVAEVEPGNFGLSTNAWKLKELSVQ